MSVEVRDVAPGLWLWRQPHPSWSEGDDWPAEVASFGVRSGDAALLLDPLAPPPSAREVWDRIEDLSPETVVVLKPDHVRDVDLFVRLPEQRALVFADALAAPEGELQVWSTPWHEERTLPALRKLLGLDVEHVLVSHGEPVHTRDDFVAALEREPWSSWHGA